MSGKIIKVIHGDTSWMALVDDIGVRVLLSPLHAQAYRLIADHSWAEGDAPEDLLQLIAPALHPQALALYIDAGIAPALYLTRAGDGIPSYGWLLPWANFLADVAETAETDPPAQRRATAAEWVATVWGDEPTPPSLEDIEFAARRLLATQPGAPPLREELTPDFLCAMARRNPIVGDA